jgi:uncharacterized surface protein with fasciclin (FAS1) repeats
MGTKKTKKSNILISSLLVGTLALGAAACSSDSDEESSSSKASTETMVKAMETDGVTVGGAKMVKEKDIVDNAVNAKNVSTVVSLVQLADLVDTLKSEGPFTVFAPNNGAFEKIDADTIKALQDPANVDLLKGILTYHVVSGTYTSADLKVMAKNGETLTTVQGEMLTPELKDNMVVLKDAKGNITEIETTDVISSNGVTHVIKSVLMPAA